MYKISNLDGADKEHFIKEYYTGEGVDAAHGMPHIDAVRNEAAGLAKDLNYKKTGLLDDAALLHDIGNKTDRAAHATIGADIVLKHPRVLAKYGKRDVLALAHAIREHRASTGKPKTKLARLLRDADRLASFSREGSSIARAYSYSMDKNPHLSDKEHVLTAAEHIANKYGPGGYGIEAVHTKAAKERIARLMKSTVKGHREQNLQLLKDLILKANKYS